VAYITHDDLLFAVRAYPSLQGLRLVPLGVVFLAKVPFDMAWPGHSYLKQTVWALMFLAAFAGFFLAGAYYHRRFGKVEPQRGPLWGCLGLVVFTGLYLAFNYLDVLQDRLSFSSLFMVGLCLACYITSKGRRWYYLPLALMFTALTVLPLTGMVSPKEMGANMGSLFNQALGLFLAVGGVLDHRLLCRVLAAPAVLEGQDD
jgi:hypothetical protein